MSNQLKQLLDAGQSVWLDNLRRSMFASGELKRLIDQGLRGMTSNPTIFEKAIGTGNDYDDQLRQLIKGETDADALFWDLAVQDIQAACDAFRGVYDSSGGNDGFVSLEVSPLLAHDTKGTIDNALSLWKRVDRPNLMVKIPGTNEGVPAIEECIYQGLNINVTLIFSVEFYEKTASAYIKGLERRIAEGKPVDTIRSVNSVFVSRIDSAIDKILQSRIDKGESNLKPLLGKTGIANLKLTYQKFKELFESDSFKKAAAKGAAVQRPLWASTSTKNPSYPDLMYVETVVGKHTVNTMPPNTLEGLLDHGKVVADTVESDLAGARAVMQSLADSKVSLFEVTHQLQVEGVSSFSDSFAALMGAIVYKQKQLSSGAERVSMHLHHHEQAYKNSLDKLASNDFLKKLWAKDPSPWTTDAKAADIVKHALGWLDVPQHLMESVPMLQSFAKEIAEKYDHVVVLGMGGSSLCPDVLRETFGKKPGYPQLHVLDSTCPSQIATLDSKLDIAKTLFVVSSKSGSTTEPNAFFAYYYDKVAKLVGTDHAGAQFVAVTDPNTSMGEVAKGHNFLHIFENDANIGGRYSALSFFGMVPAALAGYDVNLLLDRGLGAVHANDKTVDPKTAPGVQFGAAIGGLAVNGHNKLTIITHPSVSAFGAWAEQLIAESTGKEGKGIVPVEGEALSDPLSYEDDRVFVYQGANLPNPAPDTEEKLKALEAKGYPVIRLAMNDQYDLGEAFYLWEIATAAAGSVIGINAFDQPNVQESKDNTKRLLDEFHNKGSIDEPAVSRSFDHFDVTLLPNRNEGGEFQWQEIAMGIQRHDYVAICAYLEMNDEHRAALDKLRLAFRDKLMVATTVGFGPRFLHSTGQLHKGGPKSVYMIQITTHDPNDPPIPGMNVGFRTLIAAQALGDFQSLEKRDRRGLRVRIKGDVNKNLPLLVDTIIDGCFGLATR